MVPDPVVCPAAESADPVVTQYRTLFATLDWSVVEPDPWAELRSGPVPTPVSAYLKALIVKADQGLRSIPALRQYLLAHPRLAQELGFGAEKRATLAAGCWLPSERWLRTQQHRLAPLVHRLLDHSVRRLAAHLPTLASVTALDATHHLAWVKQNNQNQTVTRRFDPTRQPAGDPDCRLGAKTLHPRPFASSKHAFWGYHSAIVATETSAGPVVLGATVAPVVAQEVQLARALIPQVTATLGHAPNALAADAAFDAWWVWDWPVAAGGMAAIAANRRRGAPPRSPDGHPICAAGHVMRPTWRGTHRDHAVQTYGCPLRSDPAATCADPRFATGGCGKQINSEPGGMARALVDRSSPAYQTVYAQRTCAERVFSQIKRWGLGRPCARSLATVTTVILCGYLLLNLRTLRHLLTSPSVRE
jgi:hypothetical protein